jgi:hypothetical protein
MSTPFTQPHVEEEGRRWAPVAIGAAVIVLVLLAILYFGRPSKQEAQAVAPPYAEYVQIGALKMSSSDNFVGATVYYVDGKLANVGSKTLTAATIEATFRNSLGQVVQKESQPLMLYHTGMAGFPDVAPLSAVPLGPNTTREFRLTFEHISADWDHGYPELRFTRMTVVSSQ